MTICIPSMQEWGAIFDAGQPAVQLTFSGYVVAYGCLQLLYGPLSDRVGRKKVLMTGLTLAFVGSVLAALAPGLPSLTAARVLQGAGCAAVVVGRAMVQDLFSGPERTRVMAYVGMCMGLCPPAARILGGQLRAGGMAGQLCADGGAGGRAVGGRVARPAAHQPHTTVQPHWLRAMGAAYARLAREPAFLLYVSILSMTGRHVLHLFLGGAPIVLGSYGVGPDRVGFYIMFIPLSYIVGSFITSRLSHRVPDAAMAQAGHTCTVAGVGLMLALGLAGVHSPLAFALPLVLMGAGHGLLMPSTLGGAGGRHPCPGRRGGRGGRPDAAADGRHGWLPGGAGAAPGLGQPRPG